ncbi:2677_t:CDS:2 [Cetraspora pellucida]|uniref:2677_t:CDS:1 n=1 Tax=Cetraspora pellucida TaxID=1433469 RepID=A0A9N9N771_9GLOM|nr:2677_t:CDS:2 [Cetraspora pellucida]
MFINRLNPELFVTILLLISNILEKEYTRTKVLKSAYKKETTYTTSSDQSIVPSLHQILNSVNSSNTNGFVLNESG